MFDAQLGKDGLLYRDINDTGWINNILSNLYLTHLGDMIDETWDSNISHNVNYLEEYE